jgi:hypothetical protein
MAYPVRRMMMMTTTTGVHRAPFFLHVLRSCSPTMWFSSKACWSYTAIMIGCFTRCLGARISMERYCNAGLSNAAPVIYFPGALIYSAGFNVNQNFKKKIFVNNICFNFFRSTPMNTVSPLLQSCFLLYPVYCPLTPPFPFSLEKEPASQVIPLNK